MIRTRKAQRIFVTWLMTFALTVIISIAGFSQQAPPAPAQDYDRFGSYFWTTTYKGWERLRQDDQIGLADTFVPGVNMVASLGTRTIRVVPGANYGNRFVAGQDQALRLVQYVNNPSYPQFKNLFLDSRFSTYILTYFPGGWNNSVTDGSGKRIHTPPANYNDLRDQVKELADYLLGQENGAYRFPGKKFILLNWEADSLLGYVLNDPKFVSGSATQLEPDNPVYASIWVEFEKAIRAASEGVKQAKLQQPLGPNKPEMYFGVEYNVVNAYRASPTVPCGGGNPQAPSDQLSHRCAISYLPARLNLADFGYSTPAQIEYWSYSAWDSVSSPLPGNTNLNLSSKLRDDLNKSLGWMNRNRGAQPQYQPHNLIIGEFGHTRNTYLKLPSEIPGISPCTYYSSVLADRNCLGPQYSGFSGESYSARFAKETMDAIRDFGVSYAIFFQTTDSLDPNDFLNVFDGALLTSRNGFLESNAANFVRTAAGEAFARTNTSDIVWIEDAIPTAKQVYPSGTWQDLMSSSAPRPLSGTKAFQTSIHQNIIPGIGYVYYFENAPQPMVVSQGDTLFAYVFLDPANPPSEIMLQWKAGPNQSDWDHRAYWGANLITAWGNDGTASRRRIGNLPPTGKWVRLEAPANVVGLDNSAINGFSLTITNGRAAFDRTGRMTGEYIWVDDGLPGGQFTTYVEPPSPPYPWMDTTNDPLPISGNIAYKTGVASGVHIQYFYGSVATMKVNGGDRVFAYVYLDPANPPETVMLQWKAGPDQTDWEHRAYWGKPKIFWAPDGTQGNYYMGQLPPLGQWVRLEVLADKIGLAGTDVNGFALTLYGGKAAWDRVGKYTRDVVWLDENDSIPDVSRDGIFETPTIAAPVSGNDAFQLGSSSGVHQLVAYQVPTTLTIDPGDTLFAYVYIDGDPNDRPRELMFQWKEAGQAWGRRAYWEEDLIGFGDPGPIDTLFDQLYEAVRPADDPNDPNTHYIYLRLAPVNYRAGTDSRRYMGVLPERGKWVRLEIPASRLGLEGKTIDSFAFTLYGGKGIFDRVGKVRNERLDQ